MAAPFTTRPELAGDFGMAASSHYLATATAMSVLERGGNAADAAVAAGFVLQVVEPQLNGPAGDAPIMLWSPDDQRVRVIAGQGGAPAGATISHYRDAGVDAVPGTGLLAATIPGAMGAWLRLLSEWGTWRLRDVLEPAIAYAEKGWLMSDQLARTLRATAGIFAEEWQTSAAVWLDAGGLAPSGPRLRNPMLASTWRRLLDEAETATDREGQIERARAAFYQGFIAEAIADHMTKPVLDSSGLRHAGVLGVEDLAGWLCPVEDPVSFDYGEYTVLKTGPWGQGPVLLQQLALLSQLDLGQMEHLSADYIHTVVEASKLAYADRDAWYGDPDFANIPMAGLLSESYNRDRARLVGPEASRRFRPGSPGGLVPRLPSAELLAAQSAAGTSAAGLVAGPGSGEPTVQHNGVTRGDTCHLDVVDGNGLMVSATPSGGWLQSSPAVDGLGFCLNTRLQMTWLEPGLPSSLRPGARPMTTLSPTLALRNGRPYLAFGTPGGDQQDQWSLHFFLAHVHGGGGLQWAIDQPSLHSTHLMSSFWPRTAHPAGLVMEGRFDPRIIEELRRRGHEVSVAGDWALGRVTAVSQDPPNGFLRAAASARGGQSYAIGR